MIENKELGLKIAENPTEALWSRSKDATKKRIEEIENSLIIERAFLELCETKLSEIGKSG